MAAPFPDHPHMSESDVTPKETDTLYNSSTGHESTTFSKNSTLSCLLDIRIIAFFIMEAAFVALTWRCFHHPLSIPYVRYSDLSTARSGFVAFFNTWHTIAIACSFNTCFEAFSREWAARPQRIDIVSTTCSGVLDRLMYSVRSRATKTFRASLVLFLCLTVLRTTGSSAITVAGSTRPGSVRVADLKAPPITGEQFNRSSTFSARLNQANLITRLEQLHGVTTGFKPPQNWLIPLPSLNNGNNTVTVSYDTDIVHFNYSCRWQAPNNVSSSAIIIGGEAWSNHFVENSDPSGVVNASTVVQLTPYGNSTGTSVFLFLGGTYRPAARRSEEESNNGQNFVIGETEPNVEHGGSSAESGLETRIPIPFHHKRQQGNTSTSVIPSGLTAQWIHGTGALPLGGNPWEIDLSNQPTANLQFLMKSTTTMPVATLLICDPQLRFISGTVKLSPISDTNGTDITVSSTNAGAIVGNIDQDTVRAIFSWALSKTSGPLNDKLDTDVDSMGLALFLGPGSQSADSVWHLSPLDPTEIQRNVAIYTLSSLKAFTAGFSGNSSVAVSAGETDTPSYTIVNALYDNDRLALSTGVPFAIGHSLLFVIVVFGLVGLRYLNMTQGRVPFDLRNIEKELYRGGNYHYRLPVYSSGSS